MMCFLPVWLSKIPHLPCPECSEKMHDAQIGISHRLQICSHNFGGCSLHFGKLQVDPRFSNATTLSSRDLSKRCSPAHVLQRFTRQTSQCTREKSGLLQRSQQQTSCALEMSPGFISRRNMTLKKHQNIDNFGSCVFSHLSYNFPIFLVFDSSFERILFVSTYLPTVITVNERLTLVTCLVSKFIFTLTFQSTVVHLNC